VADDSFLIRGNLCSVNRESKPDIPFAVRRATEADAAAIISILEGIASERIYTAISKPWSADQQRHHLASLSAREVIHVAETEGHALVGYQILELWAPTLDSMAHVGQIGTFLRPEWRGRGIGEALFRRTVDFASPRGYLKFVIQVRSSNISAQRFYQRLGFRECGRLTRQVRIDEQEDDEIIMEFFL
jgi:ribosomal protein S18 acetylase RimI-like enzyme